MDKRRYKRGDVLYHTETKTIITILGYYDENNYLTACIRPDEINYSLMIKRMVMTINA